MTKHEGLWHQPLLYLAPTTAALRGVSMPCKSSLDGRLARETSSFCTFLSDVGIEEGGLLSTSFETIPISRLCTRNDSQGDVRRESRQGLIPPKLSFFQSSHNCINELSLYNYYGNNILVLFLFV